MYSKRKYNVLFLLIFILLVTMYIYWPGLYGDYVFDDQANILDNKKIQINNLDINNIVAAWLSGGAGPLGRPVSMLSFSLNYYLTGFDPFYFKLTNLIIHLINGILIYLISSKILERLSLQYNLIKRSVIIYLACFVSFIWLIHPLNLTSVLYVVQRMTSLSALFGFLAISLFSIWRCRNNTLKAHAFYSLAVMVCLILSILSKESGILFVLLIYWLELIIFQGRRYDLKKIFISQYSLIKVLWVGVFLGFLVFLYLLPPYLNPQNFLRRDFNLEERLLTESRVIFYYLKMFFYPLLSELSLYHDDFTISKTITNPITTLYSLIGLLFVTIITLILSKKHPLLFFAWGWYVISQLLESTFISLELVHEHRNYFGTVGFIIAISYYIGQISNNKLRPFIYIFLIGYGFNLAVMTWQRANIWSNLVDHAAYEAAMHPKSERANYQMARIYMKLMDKFPEKKDYYAELTQDFLTRAKESYTPGNGAWFAELHLDSYLNRPVQQKTIDELIDRLETRPFLNSNISFLSSFASCQINAHCSVDHPRAVRIISAALNNPSMTPDLHAEIYKLLAQYYVGVLADFNKGEEFIKQALTFHNDINGHLLLAQIYRLQGKIELALGALERAKKLDPNNAWLNEIKIEERNINAVLQKSGVKS